MIPKSPEEKLQLKKAKTQFAYLKKNKPLYDSSSKNINAAFSRAEKPLFDSLIFNGTKI